MPVTCLKCGKDTSQNQVFCDRCLSGMEAYPVKPGTPIHLPSKNTPSAQKKAGRRRLTLEEKFARLKKVNLGLLITIGALLICLGLSITALVFTGQALTEAKQAGKNFTVDTSAEP